MVEATQTFSSAMDQLAAMRAFLDTACRRAWSVEADDEALCQLELATHEAATNIIRHAYAGQTGRPITMTITADSDSACVTLRHEAGPFDPQGVPPPRFDGSRFGGFGVYLIQQLVDEVSYEPDDDGRSGVRLVKRRPSAQQRDAHATDQ